MFWFELNLYCFLKRRNVSGLVVQIVVRPLALVFQKSFPSLGSSHPHCTVSPCVYTPYLHNCLLIAPIIFWHSTCLKPNLLFTTSHRTTLNTHTYVNLKLKQRASFSPIFVFGTTILQLKLDSFFFIFEFFPPFFLQCLLLLKLLYFLHTRSLLSAFSCWLVPS